MIEDFKIYDASAGSGKTFNLASKYIATAMICGFENILAVTFTNAAAKEMKDRIVEVLHGLSNDVQNPSIAGYKKAILTIYEQKTGILLADEDLQRLASVVLKDILHKYSFFNISTIDSFFQLVLKNLTKELGIKGNYRLSVDISKYNEQSVKALVSTSDESEESKQKIYSWLSSFFIKKSEDNKSWNIEKELTDFCADAFQSNDVLQSVQSRSDDVLSLENLEKISSALDKSIKSFRKELNCKTQAFFDRCKALGLTVDDFKGKSRASVYAILEKKFPDEITENILDSKEYPDEVAFEIGDIINYLHKHYKEYHLNKVYHDCIYPLGVVTAVAKIRSDMMKQDNVFLLDDTAFLLNRLNEGDVPFVFEKISQRISHIFIDEFQDTNRSSYENLLKIISECVQNGGSASVFGDIKQSIYRFNGGDFTILRDLTAEKQQSVIALDDNFRSLGNIVRFNNDFFAPIYSSQNIKFYPQNVKREDNIGIVRIGFTEDKNEMFNRIKDEINYYHKEKGYALDDIAVLFRDNKQLIQTANLLKADTECSYNPVSDIAFKFSSSLAVTKIIEALKYLLDNTRKISLETVTWGSDVKNELDDLAKHYKKEKSLLEVVIKISSVLAIDDDAVFLPAFFDTIKDFVRTRSATVSEFLDFWDETLQNKSVEMAGVNAGVHLTSIHKSKGLAYRVVIVPYCDNKFFRNDNIWVKSQFEDDTLPIFMTKVSNLESTRYNDVAEREKTAQYMDLMNLIYVAFTRSRDNLSVLCTLPPKTFLNAKAGHKDSEVNCLNKLLYRYVTEVNGRDFVLKPDNIYLYRNCEETLRPKPESETAVEENILIDKIVLTENNVKFSTSEAQDLEEYFNESYKEKTQREKGSEYHSILSCIASYEDKQKATDNAEKQGLDPQTAENIIDAMFENAKELHWFDKTYKVLNERTVLFNDGTGYLTEKRPDRIMISDDEVIVVDYKFGKAHQSYVKQVCEYKSLLENMPAFKGKTVKAFLWYINADDLSQMRIENVDLTQ